MRQCRVILSALVCLIAVTAAADDNHPCPCEVDSAPSAYSGSKKDTGVDFTWFSDVDDVPTSRQHCYERYVKNHLAKATLKFDWAAARLKSDALAPKGVCRDCEYYGDQTTREGPLNYGRGNDSVSTSVYEGRDEPAPSTSLFSVLQVDGMVSGMVYPVVVEVESSVMASKATFTLQYSLRIRKTSKPVVVEWAPMATASMAKPIEDIGRNKMAAPTLGGVASKSNPLGGVGQSNPLGSVDQSNPLGSVDQSNPLSSVEHSLPATVPPTEPSPTDPTVFSADTTIAAGPQRISTIQKGIGLIPGKPLTFKLKNYHSPDCQARCDPYQSARRDSFSGSVGASICRRRMIVLQRMRKHGLIWWYRCLQAPRLLLVSCSMLYRSLRRCARPRSLLPCLPRS